MRQRATRVASGVAALALGYGLTSLGTNRHAPVGHREPVALPAAPAPADSTPGQGVTAWLEDQMAEEQSRAAVRTAEAERLAGEAEAAAEAERVAEAERIAARGDAERAKKAAEAVAAPRVTPAPVRPAPAAPAPAPATGNTSGVDIDCESGSNYGANTGNGFFGAYQFLMSTWRGAAVAAGYPEWANTRPDLAPTWVQDAVAAHHAITNRDAWPNC